MWMGVMRWVRSCRLQVKVGIDDLPLALPMALPKVADVVVEGRLDAIDLLLDPVDFLVSWHHELDVAKDVHLALDHLATDTALDIALDDDGTAFCMGGDVDERVLLDDDGATEHEGADIIAGIALDPDRAAFHAPPVAAVGAADMVLGIAIDKELAAFHLDPAERVHVPRDVNLTALHPAADIHVCIAVDSDRSGGHLGADVFHPGAVTGNYDIGVCCGCACLTADGKEVPDGNVDLTFVSGECCDLCGGFSCKCVRSDTISLEHQFRDFCGFQRYCCHDRPQASTSTLMTNGWGAR